MRSSVREEERRQKMREDKERRERRKRRIERGEESSSDEEDEGKENEKVDKKSGKDKKSSGETADDDKPRPRKIKKDVWKKVTVGDVFDEAVAKYFRRKAERSGFPWEA